MDRRPSSPGSDTGSTDAGGPALGGAPGGSALGPGEAQTFSISELSRAFSVTPRTIRFYESKGLLEPRRQGQARVFTRRDRGRLALILRGKRVGFSLHEIKEMLDLYDLRDGQETQLRHALAKFDERIRVLKAQRDDIDTAIGELQTGQEAIGRLLTEKKDSEVETAKVIGFAVPPVQS